MVFFHELLAMGLLKLSVGSKTRLYTYFALLPHLGDKLAGESADFLLLYSKTAASFKVDRQPYRNLQYFHTLLLRCFGVMIVRSGQPCSLVSSTLANSNNITSLIYWTHGILPQMICCTQTVNFEFEHVIKICQSAANRLVHVCDWSYVANTDPFM